MNSFMTVNEVSKAVNIAPGLLYDWAKKKKVETKTSEEGVMQLSLESVKAYRKASPVRRSQNKVKAVAKTKPKRKPIHARPATKQADITLKMAAVLEIFFPEGIPVGQYANVLILTRALEAAMP